MFLCHFLLTSIVHHTLQGEVDLVAIGTVATGRDNVVRVHGLRIKHYTLLLFSQPNQLLSVIDPVQWSACIEQTHTHSHKKTKTLQNISQQQNIKIFSEEHPHFISDFLIMYYYKHLETILYNCTISTKYTSGALSPSLD